MQGSENRQLEKALRLRDGYWMDEGWTGKVASKGPDRQTEAVQAGRFSNLMYKPCTSHVQAVYTLWVSSAQSGTMRPSLCTAHAQHVHGLYMAYAWLVHQK